MQTTLLILSSFTTVLLIVLLAIITQIRNRSRRIINFGHTDYHFEIINGPSVEEILTYHYEWNRNFGFEIAPKHERGRSHSFGIKHPINRKSISYFIVPEYFDQITHIHTKQKLFPNSRNKETSEHETRDLEKFLSSEFKDLNLTGPIFLTSFDGTYRDKYCLDIIYNTESKTGNMIIREE